MRQAVPRAGRGEGVALLAGVEQLEKNIGQAGVKAAQWVSSV